MSIEQKQKTIDELIEKARASLEHQSPFEAERMALKALLMTRQIEDWQRMIAAVEPLRTARAIRLKVALTVRKITVIAEPITENTRLKPGPYLVEPPHVGADARRLRMAGLQGEIPVAVLCREPLTKLKQWPIVAVGAGITLRTRIDPPRNGAKPDLAWFKGALDAIGDWAVQTIDPTIETVRRIDVMLERLDTVPDHPGLHDCLVDGCRQAIAAQASDPSDEERPRRRRGGKRASLRS